MTSDVDNRFYVYAHYRKDTDEIFYIGKGTENRAYKLMRRAYNPYWWNIYNKHGVTIKILYSDLLEEEAFEIEKALIWYYGRKDMGLGPLCNMSDGGEGASGTIASEDLRKLRSENAKKYNPLYKRGRSHSDDSKKRQREKAKIFWSSPEERRKQSLRIKHRAPDSLETREKKRKNLTPERARKMAESARTPEKRAALSVKNSNNFKIKRFAKKQYDIFSDLLLNKISIKKVREILLQNNIDEQSIIEDFNNQEKD